MELRSKPGMLLLLILAKAFAGPAFAKTGFVTGITVPVDGGFLVSAGV